MKLTIFTLSTIIFSSIILDWRIKAADRLFSFGLVRVLFILPLLIMAYFSAYVDAGFYSSTLFYNPENALALLWLVLAYRLYQITSSKGGTSTLLALLVTSGSVFFWVATEYAHLYLPSAIIADGVLVIPHYGVIYCSSCFLLSAIVILGWRLETFWRSLDSGEKYRYKYLMISLCLACAMLGWSCSYRLAYLCLPRDHILLLTVALFIAWIGMIYSLAIHRLLNRKLFISRKVVYATITPLVISGFFILLGVMALLTRLWGWSVPFVAKWLIIIMGILIIVVFALSGSFRKRVKYFVSTHFYVNKYEYRDEWLAFSDLLQGRLTEGGVVEAMYQILRDSLYARKIMIWMGDTQRGFRLSQPCDNQQLEERALIAGDDPIVCYLHNAPYLYSRKGDDDSLRRSILTEKEAFLQALDIVLMVPLILGNQCVGLIGLGPETTGGTYGQDDFDLMAALSSHAASALLAVRNAENLAQTRELSAWNNLSAFVLHDIKNAATMLELTRKNAAQHINNSEFQKDMLETIDDAVLRMTKVQTRLSSLKGEMVPEVRPVILDQLLRTCCERLGKKLPGLVIELSCPQKLLFQTDSNFICQILENLLMNAWEAGGAGTVVRIGVTVDSMLQIDLIDNGPGISAWLLPRALFEPLRTAKPNGSGIGLWQVQELAERLGGDIQARNMPEGGAMFTILFPYDESTASKGSVKNSNIL